MLGSQLMRIIYPLWAAFLASFSYMPAQVCAVRIPNNVVRHYEPLSYAPIDVHRRSRWKRSASTNGHPVEPSIEVAFRAYKREFRLHLGRDRSSFSSNFALLTNQGPVDASLDHLYSGYVEGVADSRVVGAIIGGVFIGRISLRRENEEFHVELASRFFPPEANRSSSPRFHSVVYSSRDVRPTGHLCGLHGATAESLRRLQMQYRRRRPKVARRQRPKRSLASDHLRTRRNAEEAEGVGGRAGKFHRAPNDATLLHADNVAAHHSHLLPDTRGGHVLSRTSPRTPEHGPRIATVVRNGSRFHQEEKSLKLVCNLEINVDHTLVAAVESDMLGDEVKARQVLTNIISTHTAAASEIFSATDFGGILGVSFTVQRVKGSNRGTNPFCREDLDAAHLLRELASINHNGFCASFLWTHRPLPEQLLGLAFVAEPEGGSGGVCDMYRDGAVDDASGTHRGPRSLNTGLVTFQNNNGRVPQRISEITFAHELGHSFGANHDETVECSPGGTGGNFIMFARAQPGTEPNNRKFSPCSITSITLILNQLSSEEGDRANCLQEPEGPFCGNLIREGAEQCDCGYDAEDCKDICCHPRRHTLPCTLVKGAICSPSSGECCAHDCTFHNTSTFCRPEDDCNYPTYCSGSSGTCPEAAWKPDGILCNHGTQLCHQGDCTISVCQRYDLLPCFLTGSDVTPSEKCLIACKEKQPGSECKEACHFERMRDLCHRRMEPGAACDDLRGYCDVFQRCRLIDSDGPLSRLHGLIFGEQGLTTPLLRYWYLTLLALVGTAVVTLAALRVCTVHISSSNPQRPPRRTLTDTVIHPLDFMKDFLHL